MVRPPNFKLKVRHSIVGLLQQIESTAAAPAGLSRCSNVTVPPRHDKVPAESHVASR
jgi:hypothetical protein